jgi:hypothetical protein
MQRALDTWALVSRDALGLPADSLPWIVLFDARCTWHLAPRGSLGKVEQDITGDAALRFGGAPVMVRSLVHGDSVQLPSGRTVPPQPTAFASLYRGDSASFFVITTTLCRRSSTQSLTSAGRSSRSVISSSVPRPHRMAWPVAGWHAERWHSRSGATPATSPASVATRETVLAGLRQGRYWSQEMGLAMTLVLDVLLPEWQSRVFAEEPASIYALLHEAVR